MAGEETPEAEAVRARLAGATWRFPGMTEASNPGQAEAVFQDMQKSLRDMQANIQEIQKKLYELRGEYHLKRAIAEDWHGNVAPGGVPDIVMNAPLEAVPWFLGVPPPAEAHDSSEAVQASGTSAAPKVAVEDVERSHTFSRGLVPVDTLPEAKAGSEAVQAPEAAAASKVSDQAQHSMDMDTLIRGGSYIVGATSIMSLVATMLSGAIIIQPLFAMTLLILCIGFYCMTLVKR